MKKGCSFEPISLFQATGYSAYPCIAYRIIWPRKCFCAAVAIDCSITKCADKICRAASGTFSTFQQTASALGVSTLGGLFFCDEQTSGAPRLLQEPVLRAWW